MGRLAFKHRPELGDQYSCYFCKSQINESGGKLQIVTLQSGKRAWVCERHLVYGLENRQEP